MVVTPPGALDFLFYFPSSCLLCATAQNLGERAPQIGFSQVLVQGRMSPGNGDVSPTHNSPPPWPQCHEMPCTPLLDTSMDDGPPIFKWQVDAGQEAERLFVGALLV